MLFSETSLHPHVGGEVLLHHLQNFNIRLYFYIQIQSDIFVMMFYLYVNTKLLVFECICSEEASVLLTL